MKKYIHQNFRCDEKFFEKIERAKETLNMSKSEAIRWLIMSGINSLERNKALQPPTPEGFVNP